MKTNIFKNLIYVLRILYKENKNTFFCLCMHILSGAIAPFIGVIIPSVIIYLLLHQTSILYFALSIGTLLLVYGLFQGIQNYLKEYNAFAFISIRGTPFMDDLIRARTNLDYDQLEDAKTQKFLEEAQAAVRNNTEGVEGLYHNFINFAIGILGLILYALMSGGLSIWLALGLFVLVILQYVSYVCARNYEFSHREEYEGYVVRSNYLNNLAYDVAAGKDIRIFQLQDWINAKFSFVNHHITRIRSKDYNAYMVSDTITILLDFLRDITCYGFLIYKLTQGLPIDQFVFYLGIISGFSIWFKKVGESFALLSSDNVMTNRMFEALRLKNKMHHGEGETLHTNDITITFDHVSFAYPNQSTNVINDVSFHIHTNEKIALVGVNGAGKTTIVKLILGFYVPTKGSVKINGVDTRDLDMDDVYTHITGIFQNSTLLSYTLAENVSMKLLEESDMELVRSCLTQAGLWNYICKLPDKEKTYLFKDVHKDGIQLSGGQVQKLLMARALYRRAGCLLLDEPTAALDAIAEKEMYESYHEIMKDKTGVFISHRLSSTRFCDTIFVLDKGSVVEEGTHDELLANNGMYTSMFVAQSKYYEEVGENHEVNHKH